MQFPLKVRCGCLSGQLRQIFAFGNEAGAFLAGVSLCRSEVRQIPFLWP